MKIPFNKCLDLVLETETDEKGVRLPNSALVALALVKNARNGDMEAIKMVVEHIKQSEKIPYNV